MEQIQVGAIFAGYSQILRMGNPIYSFKKQINGWKKAARPFFPYHYPYSHAVFSSSIFPSKSH